jgi:hypothetical protein
MRKSVRAAHIRWLKSPGTEEAIQRAVVKLLDQMRLLGQLEYFAVPNGGKRNLIEAARLKKQGVRRGVPDLVICLPGGRTLWWEVKTPKGGIRREQREWASWLTSNGYSHRFIRSLEDADHALKFEFQPFSKARAV